MENQALKREGGALPPTKAEIHRASISGGGGGR
jgi:hypothetical protein